jgi:2-(1,2-epoxy-1,2-dihydrophenyl)acetyl-CoA isomerase
MDEQTPDATYALNGRVAVISINRPSEQNTLRRETYNVLSDLIEGAASSDDVGAIILTGRGGVFSNGVDASLLDHLHADPKSPLKEVIREVQRLAETVMSVPKIVLAAVEGDAMGAGFDLCLACDLIFASKEARFGELFINLGLIPDGGGTFLLPKIVRLAQAKKLIFTGCIISAEEAAHMGIVSQVTEPGTALDAALETARRLARASGAALAAGKKRIHQSQNSEFAAALEAEADEQCLLLNSEFHKRRLRAFLKATRRAQK